MRNLWIEVESGRRLESSDDRTGRGLFETERLQHVADGLDDSEEAAVWVGEDDSIGMGGDAEAVSDPGMGVGLRVEPVPSSDSSIRMRSRLVEMLPTAESRLMEDTIVGDGPI